MPGMGTDAATFDRWYADMARSAQRDQIVQRALGLPPELDSSSLLPWLAIAELVTALALAPGQLLADLACGRGGYGLEVARRILVPGGRLAVSGWMSLGPPSSQLPDRLRRVRLDRDLAEAGFGHIEVTDKPEWRSAERAMWEAALQADPAADPAIGSLQREGRRVLGWIDSTRRVLATAIAPGGSLGPRGT
jgi:hypothetical protein